MGAEIAFRLNLVHGRCVGVRIPGEVDEKILAELVPEERKFVSSLAPGRHPSWVAGRLALREAFRDLGIEPGRSSPPGAAHRRCRLTWSDLISHKRTLAVGLAARREGGASIGVDLENSPPAFASAQEAQVHPDVRARAHSGRADARLDRVPEKHRRRTVICSSSLKEALYKAIDPLVGRHVAFHEASITPLPDGSASIALALSENDGSFATTAFWTEVEDHFLTTARVQRQ